jgi:hypothetical protein
MVTKQFALDKPGQRVVNITPQLAKDWLLLNKHNRKIKKIKITQYARDMRAGNWQFTGEPVKFDDNGDLLDGQNRLHAIIDAQVTVEMLVVTGLDPAAQGVMDSGAPRSAGDSLTLLGYKNSSDLAGTVRAHYMWKELKLFKHCMSAPGSDTAPTSSEIVQYGELHPGFVVAAKESKPIARQLRLPLGSVSAAYYEFVLIDEGDTDEFFSRIRGLQTGGKGDPINTLVKRCQDMALRREHVRAALGLFMVTRTWNAMRTGEYFEKFQFGSATRGWQPIQDPK